MKRRGREHFAMLTACPAKEEKRRGEGGRKCRLLEGVCSRSGRSIDRDAMQENVRRRDERIMRSWGWGWTKEEVGLGVEREGEGSRSRSSLSLFLSINQSREAGLGGFGCK